MSSSTHWFFGFVCIAMLTICMIAAVGYSQSKDLRNQTDSFGQAPDNQTNASIQMAETAAAGGETISSGLLIVSAVVVIIVVFIGGAYALTRKQKWL